jgi:hypothetical protein
MITVGRVALDIQDGVKQVTGKPWGVTDGPERTGEARVARVETPDGFVGFIALVTWPDGSRELKMTDALGDPGEYGRLLQAGTLSIKSTEPRLVAMLKAMKYGERGWASLANVDWSEIDRLAGVDAKEMLVGLGAEVGMYGDFYETSAQYRGRPGISVDGENPEALFAAWVLTRITPLMVRFGTSGVEALS